MHLCTRLSILIATATACSSDKATLESDTSDASNHSDSDSDGGPSGLEPEDAPTDEVVAEPLFEVTGGAYDIALAPDGRIFVSIKESRIDVWDPEVAWVETLTDRAGSVFGIEWHEDSLYYTTSVHRQAGSLLRLDGRDGVQIASAAGDTVFREPTDLAMAPDGNWVVTDPTVGTLFVVSPDGSSAQMVEPGVSEPSTVTADDTYVYVGGISGVTRIDWPGGEPELIDNRTVNGLHLVAGELWATGPEWGVFYVGTDTRVGMEEIRLAGRMDGDSPLYVTDWGGAAVWASTP
jgi:hypothetical protein